MNQSKYTIYSIIEDCSGRVVYVGQTIDFDKRIKAHLRVKKRPNIKTTNIKTWLFDEVNAGHMPQFKILEIVDSLEESLEAETRWVEYFAKLKQPLLNRWKKHRLIIKNE